MIACSAAGLWVAGQIPAGQVLALLALCIFYAVCVLTCAVLLCIETKALSEEVTERYAAWEGMHRRINMARRGFVPGAVVSEISPQRAEIGESAETAISAAEIAVSQFHLAGVPVSAATYHAFQAQNAGVFTIDESAEFWRGFYQANQRRDNEVQSCAAGQG